MRVTGLRVLAAGVGVTLWAVTRGAGPISGSSSRPLEGRPPTPGAAPGSGDRAAFDAYELELQRLLMAAPRSGASRYAIPGAAGSRLAGAASAASASTPGATATSTCSLFLPGAERVPASDCMSCHGLSRTHPVDLDYGGAAARRPEFYRPVAEVVRRGVFLPDGQVRCVTCHDPRSPWKDKIALPPGAVATPAVDLARPETYERPRSRTATVTRLPPGSAVTPTPLCQSCHTYGD